MEGKRPEGILFFPTDWKLIREEFSGEEIADLMAALFLYFESRETRRFEDRALRVIYRQTLAQIDRQIEKYRQTCEQNAQNARKRKGAQRGEADACGGEPAQPNINKNRNKTKTKSKSKTESKTKTETESCICADAAGAASALPDPAASGKKKFVRPSVEEIRAYCRARNNTVDAERFFDFYESKGWVVGPSPMKDWKCAVRNWERSEP